MTVIKLGFFLETLLTLQSFIIIIKIYFFSLNFPHKFRIFHSQFSSQSFRGKFNFFFVGKFSSELSSAIVLTLIHILMRLAVHVTYFYGMLTRSKKVNFNTFFCVLFFFENFTNPTTFRGQTAQT